jgi:hypothetical protein
MGNLDQDQQVEEGNINNNFQQVGLALLPETLDCDPGLSDLLSSSRKSLNNADGIRYWAKYFAPQGYYEEIKVPRCWNDFCTINLLHPERFDWVKSLLESQAWSLITKDSDQERSFTFSIPRKCPSLAPIECMNAPVDKVNTEVQNENGGSPAQNIVESTCPAGPLSIHHKRKLSKAPLSCSEVRRSDRLKSANHGFKASTCQDKPCFCCDVKPPTLTSKVIKDLGKEFCRVPDKLIIDEALKKKPCTKKSAGPRAKVVNKVNKSSKDANDEAPKKKNKKC